MDAEDLLLESGLILRSASVVVDEQNCASIELVFARKNAGSLRLVATGCETFALENMQRELISGTLCVVVRDISNRGWETLRFEIRELEREAFVVQAASVEIYEV